MKQLGLTHLLLQLLPSPKKKADKSIQDEAIAAMLNRGTDPKNIPKYVQHHIIAKEAGNHRDLDIISQIPSIELQERINNVGE